MINICSLFPFRCHLGPTLGLHKRSNGSNIPPNFQKKKKKTHILIIPMLWIEDPTRPKSKKNRAPWFNETPTSESQVCSLRCRYVFLCVELLSDMIWLLGLSYLLSQHLVCCEKLCRKKGILEYLGWIVGIIEMKKFTNIASSNTTVS